MKQIRSRVEVLSQAEIERIHRASLEILQDVGVQLPNERLLARLRAEGAAVHGDRACLPANLVERVVGLIRGPRRGGGAGWAINRGQVRVTNGNEMQVLDYASQTRRPGTREDVLKGIALTNALPMISSALPVVVPGDVPLLLTEVESYRLGCLYSSKPFNVYFGRKSAPYLTRMADILAEQADGVHPADTLHPAGQSKREVGLSFGFGVISPLRFGEDDLACALQVAEAGYPASCYSFVVVGASAPASMAGTLALSNAERLACLTMMWLWGELGYRIGFVEDPCIIEPHTLATSFGHPNLTTLAVATSQLSRFYGLGSGGGGLAHSDAKQIDYQSGYERGMGAVFCILAGGGIGNAGIVGPDEAFSFEQLVLDDASLAMVNHITAGIEVTDESLGLEVIKQVGIGGSFLDQEHTVRYLRKEYWEAGVFPRYSWAEWESRGSETLRERAHREVARLLAAHYPPAPRLPEAVAARLAAIVAEARADLKVDLMAGL